MGRRDEGVVELTGGQEVSARVIGRDRSTDLALLELAGVTGRAPPRTDVELAVGHLVIAVGHPDKGPSATFGMVAELGDKWRTRWGGEVDQFIEVDANLPRGFSGGPLLDADGHVVGINTHALLRSGATLPARTVDRVVERLRKHGGVLPGYLGVGVQPVNLPADDADVAQTDRGVLVTSVAAEGPAARGGVMLGDVIVGLDGEPTRSVHALLALLGTRAEVPIELKLMRAGVPTTLTLTTTARRRGPH